MHENLRISEHFRTSFEKGISKGMAKRRIAELGANIVDPPRDYPLWVKFLFCFVSGFAPLLWTATTLVFLSWEPFGTPPSNLYNLILALVLIVVIVVSSVFSFVQVERWVPFSYCTVRIRLFHIDRKWPLQKSWKDSKVLFL